MRMTSFADVNHMGKETAVENKGIVRQLYMI